MNKIKIQFFFFLSCFLFNKPPSHLRIFFWFMYSGPPRSNPNSILNCLLKPPSLLHCTFTSDHEKMKLIKSMHCTFTIDHEKMELIKSMKRIQFTMIHIMDHRQKTNLNKMQRVLGDRFILLAYSMTFDCKQL